MMPFAFIADVARQLFVRKVLGFLCSVAHKRSCISHISMECRAGPTLCMSSKGWLLTPSRDHQLGTNMGAHLGKVIIDEMSDAVMGNTA